MKVKKQLKSTLFIVLMVFMAACNSDDNAPTVPDEPDGEENPDNPDEAEGEPVFALGLGVSVSASETNWYVLGSDDVTSGTISVEGNGELQGGYRDFAIGGDTFYSIGGLQESNTAVNNYILNTDGELVGTDDQTFPLQLDDFKDVTGNGEKMLGISQPQNPGLGSNILFYNIDIETNEQLNSVEIPISDVYDTNRDWIFHTGMEVSGDKLYQTFYPVDNQTFVTKNTDTTYVAVYDYPALTLDTVITDTRFGPAGSFNTRDGIFKGENGDLYTVSNSNLGYSQVTRPAGIARIPAGTLEFDPEYAFNTETAANGGKIIHALYIGDNKLFAAISTKELVFTGNFDTDNWYSDTNLRLSIVDLEDRTITLVDGAPEYSGDGSRSFAAFQDGEKVYSAIKDANGILNIYETDIPTATAIKGAEVEATFVGGIAKLQ